MADEKILEEYVDDDHGYTAYYDKEGDLVTIKIIDSDDLDTGRITHTLYFQYEEIENFYYFIKEVRKLTA